MTTAVDITRLLNDCRTGRTGAVESLVPVVYRELKRLAHRQLQNIWAVDTINTTALVNEAYIKLVSHGSGTPANRAHFFAIAAKAMRQILINYAEQKQTQKRGGDWRRVTAADACVQQDQPIETLLAIDMALAEVRTVDENLAQLIELRFFAGMTEAETAAVMGVSERTVRRNWKKARALLARALTE